MKRVAFLLAAIVVASMSAGCAAEGASVRNFELKPQAIGWHVGEVAVFDLTIMPKGGRADPQFTIDADFALEELLFDQQGASFGGDFRTRNMGELELRLVRDGVELESAVLDKDTPTVELHMRIPDDLKDSSYVLEIKLFQVGWVKSEPFRTAVRG